MTLTAEQRALLVKRFSAQFGDDSPAYGRIARTLVQKDRALDIYDRLDESKMRPVTLFAAVHYLVLKGATHKLARLYAAPESREAVEEIGDQFIDFCDEYEDEVREVMQTRAVQTNEVNRCVGLLPALMYVERKTQRPLSLIDTGASAGLNLLFDRYRYDYAGGPVIGPPGAAVRLHSELRGHLPVFSGAAPLVEHRVGVDLDPVDISDPDEELWLRACVWVGQVARDQRLTAAMELARREWQDVRKGSAVALLPELVEECPEGTEICVFSSWLLGWMPQSLREAMALAIAEAGKTRSIWWISYEWPGIVPGLPAPTDVPGDGSVLALQHFEPGHTGAKERRVLGTVHHHGNWLNWTDAGTSAW